MWFGRGPSGYGEFLIDYLLDWCGLLVRWLHVVAGIAWIGSSFYFVWLDNHLEPQGTSEPVDPNVAGELWAVHGGGFYRSRKYRVAPPVLPPTLHWFYWEAYTTWLSGFGLLFLLYFLRAEAYLIDPSVLALTKTAAIAITMAVLVASWLVYDGLCRSPLGRNGRALAVAVALVTAVEAWGVCHLFGGRGAFMVFGAALGTIMVANVLIVIIPGQRELVRAKREGRDPDPGPGLRGKQRSVHNTYFTLPVIFVMISNHYAMTYGATHNWLVLIAISAAGVGIRQYFVSRHKAHERGGRTSPAPALVAVVILACLAWALTPTRSIPVSSNPVATGATQSNSPAPGAAALVGASGAATASPSFARVQAIMAVRCLSCHSTAPTQPGIAAPPNGVLLDTPEHVLSRTVQMEQQLVTRAMPAGNLTGLTDEERAELLVWLRAGAPH